VLKVIGALIPSAGLLFLFWLALRALIQADRRERAAEAKWNRDHGIAPVTGSGVAAGQPGPVNDVVAGENRHSGAGAGSPDAPSVDAVAADRAADRAASAE
jgi:hypothetical protein